MRISDWSSDVCSSDLDMLTTAIKAAQFSEGSFAVYSNQTAQRYPATASAIRALLDQHMLSPVEFVAEIDAMHAAGSRLFVELGPKGIVANMARQTLAGKDASTISQNGRASCRERGCKAG